MIWYIIFSKISNKPLKLDGHTLYFEYPKQAENYINKNCGGSKYLTVKTIGQDKKNSIKILED